MAHLNPSNILIVNMGSSSLKLSYFSENNRQDLFQKDTIDILQGIQALEVKQIKAIGHRVVHGGDRFIGCTPISPAVLEQLEELNEWAPLHNPISLSAIRTCIQLFPDIPQYACFDTAFHRTMPAQARYYAIPQSITKKWHVERYGFHGLSHAFLWHTYHQYIGGKKIITLHLGSGCSLAAIEEGRSLDTSMGFTPLEGVAMGTRSGDIDPGAVEYLGRKLGKNPEEMIELLNKKSGLLGLSDESASVETLLASSHQKAQFAIELFCYRIVKTIGAFLSVLHGAEAIIFSGGIGENAPLIREKIAREFEWAGAYLDPSLNSAAAHMQRGEILRISQGKSSLNLYVIATDENAAIYREVEECLQI